MKRHNLFLILIVFSMVMSSCKYDYILPEVVAPVSDVSFSQDVTPIFTAKCISCHKAGNTSPDLTAANAFAQIMSANLVNATTPAESKLYTFPSPTTGTHTWKKYSAKEAATVLQWIKEGAKNN